MVHFESLCHFRVNNKVKRYIHTILRRTHDRRSKNETMESVEVLGRARKFSAIPSTVNDLWNEVTERVGIALYCACLQTYFINFHKPSGMAVQHRQRSFSNAVPPLGLSKSGRSPECLLNPPETLSSHSNKRATNYFLTSGSAYTYRETRLLAVSIRSNSVSSIRGANFFIPFAFFIKKLFW